MPRSRYIYIIWANYSRDRFYQEIAGIYTVKYEMEQGFKKLMSERDRGADPYYTKERLRNGLQ